MFYKKQKEIERLNKALEDSKSRNINLIDRLEKQSRELEELNNTITSLRSKIKDYNTNPIYRTKMDIKLIEEELNSKLSELRERNNTIRQRESEIYKLDNQLIECNRKLNIQTLGLLPKNYNVKFTTDELKNKIESIRNKQKDMLKDKTYYVQTSDFYIDNNIQRGAKLVETLAKNTMRGFNLYSDGLIDKLSYTNLDATKDKISKIFHSTENEAFSISKKYLDLKLEEVDLCYQIAIAKQRNKEERELQREKIKEQELLEKELAKEQEKLNKELKHYLVQKEKGQDVDDKIEEINKLISDNQYRKEKNLSGYVYVIKNNALDGTLKIGVTRRINPHDRISELSNASVPFKYFPCAIIFSENAFQLESKLHNRFAEYKVNKLNPRKEHFKISTHEVQNILRKEFNIIIDFDHNPIDEEFEFSNH